MHSKIVVAVNGDNGCVSHKKPAGGEKPKTGLPCNTVPAIATQPSIMTMSSSTPAWDETFVFLERYHRLLVPECLLLFELVDFATAVPRKEARKVSFWSTFDANVGQG